MSNLVECTERDKRARNVTLEGFVIGKMRQRLRSMLLFCLMVFLRPATGHANEIVNLGDSYRAYRTAVAKRNVRQDDIDTHVKLFLKHAVGNQQKFYLDVVFDKRKPGEKLEELLAKRLKEAVPIFDKYDKQIRANFDNFDRVTRRQLKKLKKSIPDFRADVPIYGMVSLNAFAGGKRNFGGKTVLAISTDKIVALDRDFSMVFTHEVFHVYHDQKSPKWRKDMETSPEIMIAAAFGEGLATHAEGVLNPKTKDRRMTKTLMDWCNRKSYLKHIKEFLADAPKLTYANYHDNKQLYAKWFLTSREKNPGFPTEAGYCIGDQVVETLAKKHSLMEMASWDLKTFMGNTKAVLQSWAKADSK